jgi:hypothetical protein
MAFAEVPRVSDPEKNPEQVRQFTEKVALILNALVQAGYIVRTGVDTFTIPGATGGSVTSVGATSASADLTITGSPITSSGSFTFTVVSAPKWTTGRTVAITGDLAYTSGSLNGTGNVTGTGTLATVNSNVGSFTNASITVDGKGRITAASSGSSASGTVTTVSVTTANGVSGSVANPTTTPAITITLGAITPTSVNGNTITTGTGTLTLSTFTLTVAGTASISGTHTGTSSGTNTGDQTITLTGDVTGSGTGSFAATIANGVVTLAKIANAAASSKLLGSGASGSGSSYVEITLGTGLTMSGTTLNASGGSGGNSDIANHSLCGGI